MSQAISYGRSVVGERLILMMGMRALGKGMTVKSVSSRMSWPRISTSSEAVMLGGGLTIGTFADQAAEVHVGVAERKAVLPCCRRRGAWSRG